MRDSSRLSRSLGYPALFVGVTAIALSSITLTAVYFKFDGIIQMKLDKDGGQVLIDGRNSQSTNNYP